MMHPDLKSLINETPEFASQLKLLNERLNAAVVEYMLSIDGSVEAGGCAGACLLEFSANALRYSSQTAVLLEFVPITELLGFHDKWRLLPHAQLKVFVERAKADPKNVVAILDEVYNDSLITEGKTVCNAEILN